MKTLVVIFGLLLCATPTASEIIEIPLPDLLGEYPISDMVGERTTTLHLPVLPVAINGVWMRVSGTVTVGELNCWGLSEPWFMEFMTWFTDERIVWWAPAGLVTSAGEFSVTTPFRVFQAGADWSFLLDGEAQLTLWGAPTLYLIPCQEVSAPSGVVIEAVLVIDAEFPVPVAESTWGRIKALYR